MENRPAPLRSRRVCRFCLTESEPLSFIYDREVSRPFQVPLPLQIMSSVAIEVYSADGMPQMVCNPCRSNLDRCYRFKQQCKKADEALRAYPTTGVLPRPFPPITNDPPETANKRNSDMRPANDQSKKARLDNGERQMVQRQVENKQQQQQQIERHEMYEEDQEMMSEGEHETNNSKGESKLEPGEIRVHACNQCDRTFPLLQSLQLHKERVHRDRDYKCTECDRMFFSKYDLNKHMITHSEEKPYSCQICNKQFTRANLLQRHEKIHREELRYGCPQCDREFFTPEELEKHEEAAHKAVKPYQCNICNKCFTYKQGLERHEMLHSEDKSFSCEYCKEAFRTSTKLARHLQTHAGHRPFVCKLCPRNFLLSHHLTRHMRTHSIEKTHQCEDCDKSFKRKESLEVHQLTHVKRTGMGLTCDVCGESCRNRADYVTHIKQHIEAGEKMGPDGLAPDGKEKMDDMESDEEEEEEEEEEEQFSDGDDEYQPPSYVYKKKSKNDDDDVGMEKEDKVVYVRNKDGSMIKKTIKTLMPIARRGEQQQQAKQVSGPQQMVNTKQHSKEDTQQKGRLDDTEAQVQKIVASVFKEHKIPLKNQAQEKEPGQIVRQSSQPVMTPTIIKEEKLDSGTSSGAPSKNVKVIKRIVVCKPSGDGGVITGPIRDLVPDPPQQPPTTSSTGTKVTKRVIVRRIIRQGDTTREVIMNPDGTLIDPAELAKLPTGNVVKRVVVKKSLEKSSNIEQMLQNVDAKRIISLAQSGEDITKASGLLNMTPTNVTQVHKAETHVQPKQKVITNEDPEAKRKIEQLQKQVEKQQLKIEELQARKQQEYEGDDMLPERHDESEDEQQLPLKRVFVKRNKSLYDEEREYNDEKDGTQKQQQPVRRISKEEQSQTSTTFEDKIATSTALENTKIIIIKPEESAQDVDEMSRELCQILDSTDTVSKMQENVLNNLQEITSAPPPQQQQQKPQQQQKQQCASKSYAEVAAEAMTEENNSEAPTTTTMVEEPMEQQESVTDEMTQNEPQAVEEVQETQNDAELIVQTQSAETDLKIEFSSKANNVDVQDPSSLQRNEQTLSGLTEQVLNDANDIFGTTETSMEIDKSQNEQHLEESVIELSSTSENIHINEANDNSRDSLEDKLSQMEG